MSNELSQASSSETTERRETWIDSHHHLWRYNWQAYPWITEEKAVLARDYLLADLEAVINQAHVGGTVVVQARQTLEETSWLLDLAKAHSCIRGVVGWVPLIARDIDEVLGRYANDHKLKAVRHVIQDEVDDAYILNDNFNVGVRALKSFGLAYDILIYARHLPNSIAFVDRHPAQPFVLDHIAKPTISRAQFDQHWAEQIRELARREQVTCKFSGVATEVRDEAWNVDLIRPYFETVLEAFGPHRLMFGSDWPVCLMRTGYAQWVSAVQELIQDLSTDEQAQIIRLTATRVYHLTDEE